MRITAWEVAWKTKSNRWRTRKFTKRPEALAYFAKLDKPGHVAPLVSGLLQ